MPDRYVDEKLLEMNGVWICKYGYHIIALKLLKS